MDRRELILKGERWVAIMARGTLKSNTPLKTTPKRVAGFQHLKKRNFFHRVNCCENSNFDYGSPIGATDLGRYKTVCFP